MDTYPKYWQYDVPWKSTVQLGDWPRIPPTGFTVGIIVTYVLAVGSTAYRMAFRAHYFKKLYLDDYVLLYVVAAMTTADGLALWFRQGMYWSGYYLVGAVDLNRDVPANTNMLYLFSVINHSISVTGYSAVFAVKISYLLFFRKLIGRVRSLEIWWWIVLGILVPSCAIATFLPLWNCTPLVPQDIVDKCYKAGDDGGWKSAVYQNVNCALDIFTDLLLLSVPIRVLAFVRMDMSRKFAMASILCLSVVMIAVAILRVALYYTPGTPDWTGRGRGAPDIIWQFFWLLVEAHIAVIMVSATAFRGLFSARSRQRSRQQEGALPSHERASAAAASGSGSGRGRFAWGTRSRVTSGGSRSHGSKAASAARTPLAKLLPPALARRWLPLPERRESEASTMRGGSDGAGAGAGAAAGQIRLKQRFSVTLEDRRRAEAGGARAAAAAGASSDETSGRELRHQDSAEGGGLSDASSATTERGRLEDEEMGSFAQYGYLLDPRFRPQSLAGSVAVEYPPPARVREQEPDV